MLDDSARFRDSIKAPEADAGGASGRAAMCEGKVALDSPQLARKAAGRGRAKGIVREVYRYLWCRQWHVGQPSEKKPKPEALRLRKVRNRNGVRQC